MLEQATIARPYAEAAFAYALEEGGLADWSAMLKLLARVIADDNMRPVLHHPKLDNERLYRFIVDICGDRLTQPGKNFIKLLVKAERIGLAAEVFTLFEQKRTLAEGIGKVDVISAYPLDEDQLNTISGAVSKRIGKQVDINTAQDKDLIAGVIIKAGDAVIDVSLRGRLKELNTVFVQ